MNSFSEYLEISLKHISCTLVNENNKVLLLRLAEQLPDLFAHFLFGYEKKLIDDGKIDISVSALNNRQVHNFSSIFRFSGITELANNYIQWQRLKEFSDAWSDKENLLNELLEMTALEFDYGSLNDNIVVPSVFLGIESLPKEKKTENEHQLFKRLDVFITGIEILSGKTMDSRLKHLLEDITKKLSGRFHIFQTGLMLSREETPIKICLRYFNPQQIIDTLNELYPGAGFIPDVELITRDYCKYFDNLVLTLDINSNGIIKTGIECYFKNKKQPSKENRWGQILDTLCKDGLCDKEIANELLSFPGRFETKSVSVKEFPDYYAQGLHHIKFTAGTGLKPSAKVYLWSGFHWNIN